MNNQQAYNAWSETYDSVENKTRDLEAIALRKSIPAVEHLHILEIGCGTGKNTEWLLTKAERLIAADFSADMLSKAKEKSGRIMLSSNKLICAMSGNFPNISLIY